jgi:single-strand DNA-binding protein
MSRSLNKVELIGNVGSDPELRSTPGGGRVAQFSLATSRTWNDQSGVKQEKTEWHRCVVWNTKTSQLADIVERYVRKGEKLYIEGRIEYRQWQDKEGQTRYSTEINVRELILLSGRRAGGEEGGYEGAGQTGGFGGGDASEEFDGGAAPRAARPAPARAAAASAAVASGEAPNCPKCAGAMWDNRASKRNPKAPDFKCKDTSCDGVVWPPRDGSGGVAAAPPRAAAPAASRAGAGTAAGTAGAAKSDDFDDFPGALGDEDDDLPF